MKEGLTEEKYCIICYEPMGNSEFVEIPPTSYEPDKFAHPRLLSDKAGGLTVMKLYFEGLAYDDIVRRTGVAKGSVAAIVEALRTRRIPPV